MSRSDQELVADDVCLRLAAAIEAVASGSDALRTGTFGDDWALMWATRNRIAHGYAHIDFSIVTATVERDAPWFEDRLQQAAIRLSNGNT